MEIDNEVIKFKFILRKMGKFYRQRSMPMFSLPRPHDAIVPCGLEPTHHWGFTITRYDTSGRVISPTWQHTILTSNRHPWPRRDSNPHSQQASGRRPTP